MIRDNKLAAEMNHCHKNGLNKTYNYSITGQEIENWSDYQTLLKLGVVVLTPWGRDKIAAIFQSHFQMRFLEWKCVNID